MITKRGSACSGTAWRRRIDVGGDRLPRLNYGASWLAWLGGDDEEDDAELVGTTEGRGGSCGRGGSRRRSRVRTVGHGRESQKGDGDEQAVEGRAGECVASVASARRSAASRRWPGACQRAAATRSCPPGVRREMTGSARWAGPVSYR